jgi:tRNA modification GTPase
LTDSAGLRDGADEIEAMGMERAREAMKGCDVLLLCADAGEEELPGEVTAWLGDERAILVLNKVDLPRRVCVEGFGGTRVEVSAKSGEGLEGLRGALLEKAELMPPEEALLTHERDVESARAAAGALERAMGTLRELSLDCAALDVEEALRALREMTGTEDGAMLDRMFEKFCLGK